MFFFTIRRLLASVLVLLVSSFLVFWLCALSFDPLAKYYARNPPPPPTFFTHKAHQLGIDKPFFSQYWTWLTGAVHGDFGKTINGTPVSSELFSRLFVTGRMIIGAIILAVILAIIFGVV